MYKILIFSAAFAFSISSSAQIIPKMKVEDVKKAGMESVTKGDMNMDMNKQIKSALMKDEDLQKTAISYLKSNPETSKSLTSLLLKNKGSNSAIMQSILGDEKLSSTLIKYIAKNPKLLKQVTSIIGM
jgi:hypothetical protein|tara:strand:- start:48 stop:431 length:384 start_codon:yes stop_codon:yes gene_type:complete